MPKIALSLFITENLELDDETDEEIGQRWVQWRIPFADSWEIMAYLSTTEEIVQRMLLKSEQFIGEDGIFWLEGTVIEDTTLNAPESPEMHARPDYMTFYFFLPQLAT